MNSCSETHLYLRGLKMLHRQTNTLIQPPMIHKQGLSPSFPSFNPDLSLSFPSLHEQMTTDRHANDQTDQQRGDGSFSVFGIPSAPHPSPSNRTSQTFVTCLLAIQNTHGATLDNSEEVDECDVDSSLVLEAEFEILKREEIRNDSDAMHYSLDVPPFRPTRRNSLDHAKIRSGLSLCADAASAPIEDSDAPPCPPRRQMSRPDDRAVGDRSICGSSNPEACRDSWTQKIAVFAACEQSLIDFPPFQPARRGSLTHTKSAPEIMGTPATAITP